MFNVKDVLKAAKQVAEEKGLQPEQVIDAIESSLAAAYKREYGTRGEIVKAKMDLKSGEVQFWRVKTVVDESTVRMPTPEEERAAEEAKQAERDNQAQGIAQPFMPVQEVLEEGQLPRYNPERHILLSEAKELKENVELGEELTFTLEPHEDFGRIAAQIAKQTVLQKLRESERDSILNEWRGKEGEIVSGVVQRFERGHVYVDFGRAVGVMFGNESIPSEHYRQGERLRFYVVAVQEDTRLPGIILSRSHPRFVGKLFEIEVPEIADGTVEIKAITREPGSRTKMAVASNADGVDPIGACVGQRGTRVMAVNNELGNEKIDIIEWAEEPQKFIANALSPAKVESVEILDRHECRVFVPEDQLSLAIGRGGQNVRMAARLTGWKIDVRSQARPEEEQEGGIAQAVSEEDEAEGPAAE
jgi:N utilization substance protein A